MTLLVYPMLIASCQGSCFHQAHGWERAQDLTPHSQAHRQREAACGSPPADTPDPSRHEKKGEWWGSLQSGPLKTSTGV